jgi:hypothetical protein
MTNDYPQPGSMVDGYDYTAPISFNEHGWLASGQFPAECIADCSASGAVDEAVEYWVKKLNFNPPQELAVRYLKEYGAWDAEQLADEDANARRILWTLCCDIKEQGEWYGLLH